VAISAIDSREAKTAHAVQILSPAPRNLWRQILESDPDSVFSQNPEWLDAMCTVSGYRDCTRLYDLGQGRSVLLLLARRSPLRGPLSTAGTWPATWSLGGAICNEGGLRVEEARMIFEDLSTLPDLRIHLSPPPGTQEVWTAAAPRNVVAKQRMCQRVSLEGGFDVVWKDRFRSSVRQAVRRAEKSGVQVETDCEGRLIPEFYALYKASIERWARQQHEPLPLAMWRQQRRDPQRKLDAVARAMGSKCTVWMARVNGQAAASIIVFRHGKTAKYWRGAMDRDLANSVRANDLLHSLAIERACEDGCTWYEMGDARPGSSLARFKAGFGAIDQPYLTYWLERLPIARADALLRGSIKRVLHFRDA
jgi:Acetyltransferase (GNAT) domain